MSIGPDSLIYVTQWDAVQNNIVRFDLDGNFVDEFTTEELPTGGHLWDVDGNFMWHCSVQVPMVWSENLMPMVNDLGDLSTQVCCKGPTSIWVNAGRTHVRGRLSVGIGAGIQQWQLPGCVQFRFHEQSGRYCDDTRRPAAHWRPGLGCGTYSGYTGNHLGILLPAKDCQIPTALRSE